MSERPRKAFTQQEYNGEAVELSEINRVVWFLLSILHVLMTKKTKSKTRQERNRKRRRLEWINIS